MLGSQMSGSQVSGESKVRESTVRNQVSGSQMSGSQKSGRLPKYMLFYVVHAFHKVSDHIRLKNDFEYCEKNFKIHY